MRLILLSVLLGGLTGCFIFRGNGDATDDTAADVEPYLRECEIACDDAGIDITIKADQADRAEVEFYFQADLVATFSLDAIDDQTWIGFFDDPDGFEEPNCNSDADWVCIVGRGAEEIRESQTR